MSVAIEPTKEQKEFIIKCYPSLFKDGHSYFNKQNLFFSHLSHTIKQTSRTKADDDFWSLHVASYSKYFEWISYDEFIKILNTQLMINAKIKF
jgi:hypothetical protein